MVKVRRWAAGQRQKAQDRDAAYHKRRRRTGMLPTKSLQRNFAAPGTRSPCCCLGSPDYIPYPPYHIYCHTYTTPPPHHTPCTTRPPPHHRGRGTALWLTHDDGRGGWNAGAYIYICIYIYVYIYVYIYNIIYIQYYIIIIIIYIFISL